MKHSTNAFIITITLILLNFSLFSQNGERMKRLDPIRFEKNIAIDDYEVLETYQLSESHYFLIATSNDAIYHEDDSGLRLIHLVKDGDRHIIDFVSRGIGESGLYRPTFFEGLDRVVVVCEMGEEYSWGLDVFLLESDTLKRLGNINLAAKINNDEQQESVVPFLRIEEGNDNLVFRFLKKKKLFDIEIEDVNLFYKPGQIEEEIISTNQIRYHYSMNDGWEEIKW